MDFKRGAQVSAKRLKKPYVAWFLAWYMSNNLTLNAPLCCKELLVELMNLLMLRVVLGETLLTAKIRRRNAQLDALGTRQTLFYDSFASGRRTSAGISCHRRGIHCCCCHDLDLTLHDSRH